MLSPSSFIWFNWSWSLFIDYYLDNFCGEVAAALFALIVLGFEAARLFVDESTVFVGCKNRTIWIPLFAEVIYGSEFVWYADCWLVAVLSATNKRTKIQYALIIKTNLIL